jgi:hypothetical protein
MEIERNGLKDEHVLMEFELVHQMTSFFLMKRGRVWFWRLSFIFFSGSEELFSLISELPTEPINHLI